MSPIRFTVLAADQLYSLHVSLMMKLMLFRVSSLNTSSLVPRLIKIQEAFYFEYASLMNREWNISSRLQRVFQTHSGHYIHHLLVHLALLFLKEYPLFNEEMTVHLSLFLIFVECWICRAQIKSLPSILIKRELENVQKLEKLTKTNQNTCLWIFSIKKRTKSRNLWETSIHKYLTTSL